MAIVGSHPPDATPLDPDEIADLIPKLATVQQLNAYESTNILAAYEWLEATRHKEVLDEQFLRELHHHMFDRTWRWSGRYRLTEKNIGVAPERIAESVRNFVGGFQEQTRHGTDSLDHLAARIHHRLVWIHPFANGNGRHARLVADLFLEQHGADPFTWGADDLAQPGIARDRYIRALQAADGKDFAALFEFVRSQTLVILMPISSPTRASP